MASALTAFELRVSRRLLEVRGRLEEFFKDYDVHHTKKITQPQFIRACDLMGIRVSEREMDAVMEAYGTRVGDVHYGPFIESVDRVFTTNGLELDPDADHDGTLDSPVKGRLHLFGQKLDADEELMVSAVLQKCERLAKTRGLVFKAFFVDHDHNHNGFVTPAQFDRAMEVCFRAAITRGEVELLKKKYSDGRDVNYKAMHIDITPDSVAPGRTSGSTFRESRRVPALDAGADRVDVSRVMTTLIRQTAAKRVRIKGFFTEFDPMRTGHCTVPQFKRALVMCNFKLITEADMTALARTFYTAKREKVNYVKFCAEINAAFTQEGLERNPTKTLDCAARTIALGPRHVKAKLSPETAALAEETMQDIKTFVLQRRLGLTLILLFQDFDRAHEEFITRAQFTRVLKSINCMPKSPAAVEAVLRRYAGDNDRANTHVDYRAFLEDIEPNRTLSRAGASSLRALSESKSKAGAGAGAGAGSAAIDVGEVLKKVKLSVRKGQVRLEEFMRDYDKLRHGAITRHQFDTALSSAGVRLSAAETAALCDAFMYTASVDAAGQPFVRWHQFCDDVDTIFALKGLETHPDVDVNAVTRQALDQSVKLMDVAAGAQTGRRRLSATSEAALRVLLNRLSRKVKTRRLELPAFLHEFDRLHHGTLSESQFLRCMDRVGLPLTRADAELLMRAFRVPKPDRADINYKWFVEALDNTDQVLSHLPGTGEAPAVCGSMVGEFKAPPPDRPTKAIPRSDIDFPDLLSRIQSEFTTRRIRMGEFLRDYDQLRSGRINPAKLRTALAAAGMPLKPEELDCLERHFATDDGQIKWRELAYLVDGGDEYLEQHPLGHMVTHARRDLMASRPITDEAVKEKLQQLRGFVAYRNMLVKPFFQDYDPHRNRCVTRHQFAAVLNLLKLPVSIDDVRSLQNAFAAVGVDQKDKVNYLDFCRAVDPTEL